MGKPWEKAAAQQPRPAKPWEKAAQSASSPGALEPMGGASGEWDLSKFQALPRQSQPSQVNGSGMGPVNPMEQMGRQAIDTAINAGVKEVRQDHTITLQDWDYGNPNAPNPITSAMRSSTDNVNSNFANRAALEAEYYASQADARAAAKAAQVEQLANDAAYDYTSAPVRTADKQGDINRAPTYRAAASFVNGLTSDTANTILEAGNAIGGNGPAFDYMGNPLEFENTKPQQKIFFGSVPEQKRTRYLPNLVPVDEAQDAFEGGIDMGGKLGAAVVPIGGPGSAIKAGKTLAKTIPLVPKAAPIGGAIAKGVTYGKRLGGMAATDLAYAGSIGAMMGEDGQRLESAGELAANPLNWAVLPVASLINRASIYIKTMGARATPEVVQLEQAVKTLQNASASPQDVLSAKRTIATLTDDALPSAPPAAQQAPYPRPDMPQAAPPPPVQRPQFTAPPGPAPSKGNFMVRRADQIVGGAVGATVGGTGDAIAAPGDGSGDEGGPPMGAISGAAIGIFGPRALANASSRGFRAAARPFRGGASFDERVAAKAVREALRSSGIKSADEAAAQMAARYGDKPAAIADLAQEGVGTAAGLSRLPGKTGEAAKSRSADLLQNRSGRLFTDIESTTGIDPANVTKSIDDDIRQASQEISPAYEEMFAASRGVNSERLMQLMDDPVVAPYLRRAVQASESLATTAGQASSNARTWDLVKRGLDRTIEGQIRTSGQAAPELMAARQAVRDELDALIPEYKSIRDNADAPRMRAARKEGANAMGGRLSVEKVKKIASGLTGRPLTTMQAGMIEQLVPGIEKGQGVVSTQGIGALTSTRTEQALAAVFGEDIARNLVARVRADAALTQNASRINPNVGSVTSQAGMGGGGVGGLIAGAVRAVRNPTEAGLAWLSKSGAYSKQQRDIMGEMLLEGTTPENLQRIFRGRGGPTAPRPQGPPSTPPPQSSAATPPRAEAPSQGSYGARPSAMGDMAEHQAAQKQLKELEAYRKTAPASEHAAVDQEIADLRQFLEGKK